MAWGHGDQKLFVATKNLLHSLSVHRGIPSLQSLSQRAIAQYLPSSWDSGNLVLPLKLKVAVAEVFDPVIQVHIHIHVHVLVCTCVDVHVHCMSYSGNLDQLNTLKGSITGIHLPIHTKL